MFTFSLLESTVLQKTSTIVCVKHEATTSIVKFIRLILAMLGPTFFIIFFNLLLFYSFSCNLYFLSTEADNVGSKLNYFTLFTFLQLFLLHWYFWLTKAGNAGSKQRRPFITVVTHCSRQKVCLNYNCVITRICDRIGKPPFWEVGKHLGGADPHVENWDVQLYEKTGVVSHEGLKWTLPCRCKVQTRNIEELCM